ncbi:hypothetical protein [Boseongicola aestuarii]|uniref:Uncharacterized protein n=1 Tax=Boseongicola aestuarii TaxID=1470561 RepID=A0A238J1P6_9RHOB|nr:hypothetical protein [Boseongicola aestuarii]SMX23834.1 hypothetical protein BOA8489_01947 [Boseongicola aestuarii]
MKAGYGVRVGVSGVLHSASTTFSGSWKSVLLIEEMPQRAEVERVHIAARSLL